ncbi:MAG: hydroxyacylglutathione hydrolase [Gammaproteobacteria bacterium]|nr:hydroxyacylglutathione hydrolase [Gammaproteobacteria bacterium]
MLTIQAIPAFKDNYIWFIQLEGSQKVIIVDPGDAAPVIQTLKDHALVPIALLITHGCHDHVGGIEMIIKQYDLPIYGPSNEFIPYISHPLSECDDLVIDDTFPAIQVLDLPGHTKGHIGFLMAGNLFCGDTLFGAGCGRLHSGPAEVLFNSLQVIAQLPEETNIYCAHEYTENNLRFASMIEPDNDDIKQRISDTAQMRQQGKPSIPSTLRVELATNPFLRCDQVRGY